MRTLLFLLEKEFRQIFRNRAILRMIFIMPLVQLMVLPWAADYEVRNINLAVVDHDNSTYSRQLISKIGSSGYFKIASYGNSYSGAMKEVEHNNADLILEIPPAFEHDVVKENEASLFIALNAINGVKANLGGSYLKTVIQDYNNEVRTEWIQYPRFPLETSIDIRPLNWYNPLQDYKYFMVPGILVILITLVGTFLTALNIVKEKEIGTIEQINVTPIKKHHFILGKLIPFWILGLIILSIGLIITWLAYGILPEGSFFTIYVFAALFLAAVLGLGLLISTISHTQQQAMLISFFIMMVFILLGGLYTPIESMPLWAQWISKINPVTYFIEVMRLVMLKGSDLYEIRNHVGIMAGFAIVLNTWAVINYKKRG